MDKQSPSQKERRRSTPVIFIHGVGDFDVKGFRRALTGGGWPDLADPSDIYPFDWAKQVGETLDYSRETLAALWNFPFVSNLGMLGIGLQLIAMLAGVYLIFASAPDFHPTVQDWLGRWATKLARSLVESVPVVCSAGLAIICVCLLVPVRLRSFAIEAALARLVFCSAFLPVLWAALISYDSGLFVVMSVALGLYIFHALYLSAILTPLFALWSLLTLTFHTWPSW